MAGITKSWRLQADGAQVKREFNEIGKAGKEMSDKVRQGAAGMSPALRALDTAAGQARQKLEGAAGQAGSFGAVLRSIGPIGFAAAAGVGAAVLAFNALNTASRAATDMLGEIYTAAQRVNVSVEFLQEWRYAMVQMGEDARIVDATLGRFSVKLGQLATSPANELRAKLFAFGFSREDIDNLRTVEDALPIIADRINQLGTTAEDAALLEALGLREMQPLLQQGAERIAELARQARELGIVLDEDTLRRAWDLGGAWDAAAYALDITFKQALIDAAPVFIDTLEMMREIAAAVGDLIDQFQTFDQWSHRHLRARWQSSGQELAELQERFGDAVMSGGNAQAGAGFVGGIASRLSLEGARNRAAYLIAEVRAINRELDQTSNRLPGPPGGAISPVGPPDPALAALQSYVDRLREETRLREDIAALQAQFPKAANEELTARRALAESIRQIDEARARGVVASDAEAEALRAAAQANYDAATAVRANAAAMAEAQARAAELEQFRRGIEDPRARLIREEGELRKRWEGQVSDGELARGIRNLREEYERLAEAQYEASLEGQVLSGVMQGQIRNLDDLLRFLTAFATDSVIRELMAGGLHGEGGVAGFGRRVLDRFGRAVTGGESPFGERELGALADSAQSAAKGLTEALAPSVGDVAAKLALSSTAHAAETAAKHNSTAALLVMAKSAQAAAASLARIAAADEAGGAGKGIASLVMQALPGGRGLAGGGSLWPGMRHRVAENGIEIALLGNGGARVLPNESYRGFESLLRLADRAERAPAAGGDRGSVRVELINESGVALAADAGEAAIGPDGELRARVVLRRAVSQEVASGNLDGTMRDRFGARRTRTKR